MTETLAHGTHLGVLSESNPMNTNMTEFGWFSESFASLCFWTKLASALEGLKGIFWNCDSYENNFELTKYFKENCCLGVVWCFEIRYFPEIFLSWRYHQNNPASFRSYRPEWVNPSNTDLLSSKAQGHKDFFENHLKPVIYWYSSDSSRGVLRWIPMCQGFSHFSGLWIIL